MDWPRFWVSLMKLSKRARVHQSVNSGTSASCLALRLNVALKPMQQLPKTILHDKYGRDSVTVTATKY